MRSHVITSVLAIVLGVASPIVSAIGFPEMAIAQIVVDQKQKEAERLLQKGFKQYQTSQFTEALQSWQEALNLFIEINNRVGEGRSLGNIGLIYYSLGKYPNATKYLEESLSIARELKDYRGEKNSLSNLGMIYYSLGNYKKAINYLEQSLVIDRELKDRQSEQETLGNLGATYYALSNYATAIKYLEKSLMIAHEIRYDLGISNALLNLGNCYQSLGNYLQAVEYHEKSLKIAHTIRNRKSEGNALANLGTDYKLLGDYIKAIEYYEKSLTINRELKDRQGEGLTLGSIGNAHKNLGNYAKAIEYQNKSLMISREIGDRKSEGSALSNLGVTFEALSDYDEAIKYYQQGLAILEEIEDLKGAATSLNNIGYALTLKQQPELAIMFFKKSVYTYEIIRTSNLVLSVEQQASYTKTVESTYRRLADLLLKADRILEAQEVLELLKIQEFDTSFKESRGDRSPITFRKAELKLLEQFKAQQQGVILAAQELTTLQNKSEDQLTKQDRDRIAQLNQLQTKLSEDFIQFINGNDVKTLVKTLQRKDSGSIDPEILEKLRNKFSNQLAQLPNTALFYPLILDDRLELILITANANPIRRTVKIDRPTLNQAIADFRLALKNPRQDAKPSAQRLHDILIQPIAADLKAANIKILLYSPDRRLRYVPLGALHDGQQWLTQTLQISYITTASLTDLITPRQPKPKVLAGAISDRLDQRYTVNFPPIHREFSGLRNVIPEIATIAQLLPNTRQLREQEFTSDAIQQLSQQYNILHFATHGSFERQDPKNSFILFGGKSRDGKNYATLDDIANWKLNTDLVVLSACETGLADDQFDTKADDSVAVMGLAYKFEQAGARATIASLWVVNDSSTALMMKRFYTHLTGKTKANALQEVQQDFIAGKLKATDAPGRSEADINVQPEPGSIDRRSSPTDYTHPYFWAPFILIGNSR